MTGLLLSQPRHSFVEGTLFFLVQKSVFSSNRASGYTFQHDGAPPHTSLSTVYWLNHHKVGRFNGGFWPPQSPDCNPIEHLWPMVLHNLKGQVFSSKETLWVALEKAFRAVTSAQVKALYDSLPSRMLAVVKARGGPTRY